MQRLNLMFFLVLAFLGLSGNTYADHFTTQHVGTKEIVPGVVWNVSEVDSFQNGIKHHLTVAGPEKMGCLIQNGTLFLYCQSPSAHYQLAFNPGVFYRAPKTYQEFEQFVLTQLSDFQVAQIQPYNISSKGFVYTSLVDIVSPGKTLADVQLCVIATKKGLFTLRIQGDLDTAPLFFSSFEILP